MRRGSYHRGFTVCLPYRYPIFHTFLPGRAEGLCAEDSTNCHTFASWKAPESLLLLIIPGFEPRASSAVHPHQCCSTPMTAVDHVCTVVYPGWVGWVYTTGCTSPSMVGRAYIPGCTSPSMVGMHIPPCIHPGYTTLCTPWDTHRGTPRIPTVVHPRIPTVVHPAHPGYTCTLPYVHPGYTCTLPYVHPVVYPYPTLCTSCGIPASLRVEVRLRRVVPVIPEVCCSQRGAYYRPSLGETGREEEEPLRKVVSFLLFYVCFLLPFGDNSRFILTRLPKRIP